MLRVGGLASGMETDLIIKDLMAAKRIPLDKMIQKKQLLEWKRDDYRTMNNKIRELKDAAFDMKLESGYLSKKVTSSQENKVTVSATSLASEGQHSIKIDQLAQGASLTSGDLAGAAGGGKTLGSLNLSSDTQLVVTGEKGSKSINIKTSDSVTQMVALINNETASTGVRATYDEKLDRIFFNSTKSGTLSQVNLELANGNNINSIFGFTGSSEVTVGGMSSLTGDSYVNSGITGTQVLTVNYGSKQYNFNVTATTKVADLVSQMNSGMINDGVGVKLNSSGQLEFSNSNAGTPITFSDVSGDIVMKLGLDNTWIKSSAINAKGLNAKVEFNGIKAEYNSNSFEIAGFNFTAKETTNTAVNIGVSQDVDAVFERIKTFIGKYNTLIDDVNKELVEKKQRDFKPLTPEQREAMKEEDIKKWEEKAKMGMLSNDTLLSGALSTMRSSLSAFVGGIPDGQLKSLAEIGISSSNIVGKTISGSYSDKGKIYIDEKKLKQALTDNPEEVMAIFTKNGATEATDGIATRLHDQTTTILKQITDRAGTITSVDKSFSLGKESLDITEQMKRLTARLADMETRYYKQFTAMEKHISKMNSQSSWLSQQFSQ
ncbi:flagellar filament capping protein FliD [Paenibacillus sp. GSMTC-2017]|uniref:flagellar filament capping protein FliD n=1 Tax=Paenibacillus sp. GSMTC-2017 TaxID=2794350 RepID=UPI0018D7D51D|nr:flagellar filament capping protein FliD [Paenibacillus sp. GSMTC-2017]MBH5320625.1 flagellar filament capping protein FliD [Paenibacillus sp. GSMTC-2017]